MNLYRITILNYEKNRLKQEYKKIKELKKLYKINARNENRNLSQLEIADLAEKSLKYRKAVNAVNHELRTFALQDIILNMDRNPCFKRIIIGSGIAATMVYAEMPTDFHNSRQAYNYNLPDVIALNDSKNPNTWQKEGQRIMGQPAMIQAPSTMNARPESFSIRKDTDTNPYNYTIAEDFSNALIETQNDINMPIVNFKAIAIQSKQTLTPEAQIEQPWEYELLKHRILVEIDNRGTIKYFYTHVIDLCIGLGDHNQLPQSLVDPELAKRLMAQNKLIYAQQENCVLKGDIVFYGGSAINAAWVGEILIGHSCPDAKLSYWITDTLEQFEKVKKLNRLINYTITKNKDFLASGNIENIRELSNGKLELTIAQICPLSNCCSELESKTKTVICDQLIFSRGQQEHGLVKEFKDFIPVFYSETSSTEQPIPLGTYSQDKSIVTWGAAGSLGIGLDAIEKKEFFNFALKHGRTLPHEARAPGGIYRSSWIISLIVKLLQAQRKFPGTMNNNLNGVSKDINLATLTEIKDTILEFGFFRDEECHFYSKKIVQLRSEELSTDVYEIPGFFTIKALDKLTLPFPILLALQRSYFPFEAKDMGQYINLLIDKEIAG